MIAILKEQDDKNQYGSLYGSNIVFKCADIGNHEEAIANIKDKYNSQEPAALNTNVVSLQSRSRKRRLRVQVFYFRRRKHKKKEKLRHYLRAGKMKMKLHQQMNKYGLFCKKTKMEAQLSSTIVSLAETETNRRILSQGRRNMTLGEFLH